MKKTLITVALAFGLSAVASAATVFTVSSETPTTSDTGNRAGFTGFDFTLNNETWLTSSEALAESVQLSSLSFMSGATWFRNNNMGIAIYEKHINGTWYFVGKSAWESTSGAPSMQDFAFSDLTLSSSITYTAVFYGNEAGFNALNESSTLTSLSGLESPTEATPIAVAGMHYNKDDVGEALYSGTNASTNVSGTPGVSFTVTNVPEPATASLSLLGLAALMMHRRR